MPKKLLLVVVSVITLLVTGCGPSQAQMATALQQTLSAAATSTPLPTATPTDTPTPTATDTPTSTATATPDLRFIGGVPRDYILQPEDLPPAGQYYLPDYSWTTPHHNSEVIGVRGRENGQVYVEATGRIDAWLVGYARGTRSYVGPQEVWSNLIFYGSPAQAQLALSPEWDLVSPGDPPIIETDTGVLVGDWARTYYTQVMQPSGKYLYNYALNFTYRNVGIYLDAYGFQEEVNWEFLQGVAENMLARLRAAPLVTTPVPPT